MHKLCCCNTNHRALTRQNCSELDLQTSTEYSHSTCADSRANSFLELSGHSRIGECPPCVVETCAVCPVSVRGRHTCRTKLRRKMLNLMRKSYEQRKQGSEERPETSPRTFKPLSCCLKESHLHFSKSYSPPKALKTLSTLINY